jgi:enoyl-CoA hydratase/carnithine racemase
MTDTTDVTVDGIRLTHEGHVGLITLDRPQSLNALTREMVADMHAILDQLEQEFPQTRVIVLTGTGRGFCTGTDMKALAASVGAPRPAPRTNGDAPRERNIGDIAARLFAMPQAVIAAVNGIAVGAGFAMVLAADIRIAASSARFAGIFIDRSLPPDGGSSYTLPSIVGPAVAAEVLFTGRIYDVEWARQVGLVSSVVDDAELMETALKLATEIASKPPLALRQTKELLHRHAPNLTEIVDVELEVNDILGPTEDRTEAITAFVEKRPAVYHGR